MLQIEQRPDGGQFGVCVFTDNRQCEEWALFRGRVPGRRTAGHRLPDAGSALLRHHRRTVSRCRASCILPGGKTCDAAAYFAGTCTRQ